MSAKTSIEWTDRTWNPVRGCSRVSAGCDHCYAEGVAARFSGPGLAYHGLAKMVHGKPHWTGRIKLVEDALTEPLHWKKPCRVFVNSMADLFHEGVPDSFIDRVFAVMALAPHHTFQILTKRPERMRWYFDNAVVSREIRKTDWYSAMNELRGMYRGELPHLGDYGEFKPLPNVHLGVSVEDQAAADARIPLLLATPAAVRFISAEPLLGAVDLTWVKDAQLHRKHIELERRLTGNPNATYGGPVTRNALTGGGHDGEDWIDPFQGAAKLDWVICGGESGHGARPMHPDWARSLRDQCVAAGVPFFFKQWGEWVSGDGAAGELQGARHEEITPARARYIWADGRIAEIGKGDWMEGGMFMARVGKKRAGRMLDGRTWDGMPQTK